MTTCFRAALLAVSIPLIASCGGGGKACSPVVEIQGRFDPSDTGFVHSYAVTFEPVGGVPVGPIVLKRGDTPIQLKGQEGKVYRITINGYFTENGTGPRVSTVTVERTAICGTITIPIDPNPNLVEVVVTPMPSLLRAGERSHISVEARSLDGGTIIPPDQASNVSLTVSPAVGSFDSITHDYIAPAVIGQLTSVTITADLRGKSGSVFIQTSN